jgi:hypothetical protein
MPYIYVQYLHLFLSFII